jgi:YYY domain-containing protein
LGLLLASYLLWLGSSLGLLRNSVGGALFSILAVAVISVVYYRRGQRDPSTGEPGAADPGLLAWLRANRRLVLSVELLFAAALALWSLLRAYSPELTTAGGEKFMEIMYLNSIGRSEYFPPHDAWLSGYAISYYYFGYVMTALVTLLSGFAAHLTFNVGVANLFALTCTGAFGLVYNLVKGTWHWQTGGTTDPRDRTRPVAWGFLGAVLVAVLGNLEGFLEMLYSARVLPLAFWQWLDIQDLNQPYNPEIAPSLLPTRSGWWWWRASRVIHDLDPSGSTMGIQPIDEFPGFSFLLGDMHPHVLALPFVLLALGIALNALLGERESVGPSAYKGWLEPIKRLPLLVPLCLGALAFLNTWDFPIYWLVFLVSYGLSRWGAHGRFSGALLREVAVTGLAVAVAGFVLYLPFYIGFQSQAGGLLPTLYVGTRFRQYVVMFGPFLVAIAGLLYALAVRWQRATPGGHLVRDWLVWIGLLIAVPLGVMALIVFALLLTPQGRELLDGIRQIPAVYELVGDASWVSILAKLSLVKLRTWVMPLVVAAMGAMGIVLLQRSVRSRPGHSQASEEEQVAPSTPSGGFLHQPSIQFVLTCAIVGLLLTLSVEFFYLVDVFRVRMNTIFKFYFQAWVLMAIVSAFGVYWLTRSVALGQRGAKALRLVFLGGFWLLFLMGMVYPILGNISRANQFSQAPNLDGTAYLAGTEPEDYAAITWLNEQVPGAPVILEKPGTGGSSYVYEGRVSALTGLPTLLGWAGHENQWRGSYEIQSAREPDIETIYNTLDPEAALTLLDKYDITYVYVGPLERTAYNESGLEKFRRFMDVVYEQNGVTIYALRE